MAGPGAAGIGLAGMPGISSATAGLPAPSMMGELAQAIGQFPEQQRKVQLEKAEVQQQQTAAETGKVNAAMSQMAILARMARGNQQWETDPKTQQRLEQLAQDANFPLPRTVDGKINLDAIPGSGGVAEMPEADKTLAAGMTEAQRRAYFPGHDEAFYKAPMYMAPKSIGTIQTEFTKLLSGVGKPGGLQALQAWMVGTGPVLDQLEASGQFSRQSLVDYLNDPSVQASITAQSDAKIAQLGALNLDETSLATVRNQLLPLQKQNLESILSNRDQTTQIKWAGVGQRDTQLQIMQQNATSYALNAQSAAQNANSNAEKASAYYNDVANKANGATTAGLKIKLGVAQSSLKAATDAYDKVRTTANTILSAAGRKAGQMTSAADKNGVLQTYMTALGDPSDPNTVAGQMQSAKAAMDQASQTLQQVSAQAGNLAGTTMTRAAGVPITTRPAGKPTGGIITESNLKRYAADNGISLDAARQRAQSNGLTITP